MRATETLIETHLPLKPFKRGKVRDIYDLGDKLLIISTDRISAFDVVMPTGIPNKGEAINRLSAYWFERMKDVIPNHLVEVIDPRTMLVEKAEPIKIEFVVRGYLYGSAYRNYLLGRKISGLELPKGLKKADKLPAPIITPTTKAETGHDVEITWGEVRKTVGDDVAKEIKRVCLEIYKRASSRAEKGGLILADTKFEFGFRDGELIQIDETLTPDSSRFWSLEQYEPGKDQYSFDKQPLRDYLEKIGWNKCPPAPELPDEIVSQISEKYVECYERLTGRRF